MNNKLNNIHLFADLSRFYYLLLLIFPSLPFDNYPIKNSQKLINLDKIYGLHTSFAYTHISNNIASFISC